MAKSVNDLLATNFTTMTANLQRLSEGERLVVIGVLKELEQDLVTRLHDNPNMTSYRRSRYNAIIEQNRETIKTAYTGINKQSQDFLSGVAGVTSAGTSQIFSGVGVPLDSVVLTPEQLKSLASDSLIRGAPSSAWWSKQSVDLQNSFMNEMRMGYANGETVDELVRRVRGTSTGVKNTYIVGGQTKVFTEFSGGIMDTGTRQAEALVRTSTQEISNNAKMLMFQQNSDIIKGVVQISTLDMRTTLQCADRDGKMWDLYGKPIGHKIPWLGGPPLHWNCRSTTAPVTYSFEELGAEAGTDKAYLEQIGMGTRASMDGQVPAVETFDTWFRGLQEADQIAYLGPKKFELWKDYGLTISEMVDQRGNPLTLQQLAEAYGYKLQESMLSGLPNIPATVENAIVLEQRAQLMASEMAEEAAFKAQAEAETKIQTYMSSDSDLVKNAVKDLEFPEGVTPDQKLGIIEAAVSVEEKAASQLASVEYQINKVIHAEKPDVLSKAYQQAMIENESLLEAKLASGKHSKVLADYQTVLKKNMDVNLEELTAFEYTIKQENMGVMFEKYKSTLGDKPLPYWNAKKLNQDFADFVLDADEMAVKNIQAIDDPIAKKALEKAQKQFNQAEPGSAYLTWEKQNDLVLATFKEEMAIQKQIEDLASSDAGFKQALDNLQAGLGETKAAPSDLKKMVEMTLEFDNTKAKDAYKHIMNFSPVDGPELKAMTKTVKELGSITEYGKSAADWMMKYEANLAQIQADFAKVAQEAMKTAAGTAPIEGTVTKLGGKVYDLSIPEELATYKKHKGTLLSKYKAHITKGTKPAPGQVAAYESLTGAEKAAFDASLGKATQKAAPITQNAVPEPGVLQMSQMEKYGAQAGSNTGGFYRDRVTGTEYYLKFPGSADVARNELLASKLYQAAGVDVPELTIIMDGDQVGIASKIRANLSKGTPAQLSKAIGAGENFAVDAWLANWDVVGLGYDNLLLTEAGTAFRVDVGGALRYRAQGGLKGNAFNNFVDELDSLRNKGMNSQSASVFGKLKKADLEAGVKKVLNLPDTKIKELVATYGPLDEVAASELTEILIARKKTLAEKFPHLAAPEAAPAPQGVTSLVSNAEVRLIGEGRINGYTLPVDKDLVEDQSLLVWFEKAQDGSDRTGARFKFTDDARETIASKIKIEGGRKFDAKGQALANQFEEFKKELHLQWNVSHNHQGKVINQELVSKNLTSLTTKYDALETALLKYDSDFGLDFVSTYGQAIEDIKASLAQKTFNPLGVTSSGKFQTTPLYSKPFTAVDKAAKNAVASEGIVFKEVPGTFTQKTLKNGFATDTGGLLSSGGEWKHVYEAWTPDGTRIRIWLNEETGGRAIANQVEILTPGKDSAAVTRAMKAVEDELGIALKKPDVLAQEEMYLRMIARHRGDWEFLDAVDALKKGGAAPSERVDYLKSSLSTAMKKDVTKLPDYNPQGAMEAFNTGSRRWMRPDVVQDKTWQKFFEEHALKHKITNGNMVDTIDAVLNGGGKMTPTVDKLRKGIPWGGMSPGADMSSGGADYFFTRIVKRGEKYANDVDCLYWKSEQVARMDTISYSGDKFGATASYTIRNEAKHGTAALRSAAKISNNETIFKGGLSLFDDLDFINCESVSQAEALLKVLAKHGWRETWADGRPITELIRIRGEKFVRT